MSKYLKVIKHLLVPHRGNAFRPHAFRHRALSLYSISLMLSQLLFGITAFSGQILNQTEAANLKSNIVTYTNFARRDQKIGVLSENKQLNEAAKAKLNDMFIKNYWDHVGPEGEQAWDFIKNESYLYSLAGENLARGFTGSQEVVNAWLASPTHRANLLNNRFTEIGVAVGSGKINGAETTVIVQLLGEPKSALAAGNSQTKVLGTQKIMPEINLSAPAQPSRAPYFVAWTLIFCMIVMDGFMIRKLGLHASRSHVFNFRVSLLMSFLGLVVLTFGFVAIA